jgi:hypothetical protein
VRAEKVGEQAAEVAVGEPAGSSRNIQQGVQQGVGSAVAQAQAGDALPGVGDADLNTAGQSRKPTRTTIMIKRRRKTLVVCQHCHDDIHAPGPTAAIT